MPESLVEIWRMMLIRQNKALDPELCRGSEPGLDPEIYVSFRFTSNISVALIAYLKLKHDTWGNMKGNTWGNTWVNVKVLLGRLNWGLDTKGLHSDPADKSFLGLHIVSNISKWSNLLLKMR